MDSNEIRVSINCLVYNHEPYLRQCLDGFVMQKTNFKFEVLIHDDASTDKSTEIIREYEQKYPDIIKPIYQNENQYSKGVKINFTYQYPRAKGKYMAFCEGDDYWIDPYKLQKQFDAMEAHPECSICVHKVRRYNCQTRNDDGFFPNIRISNGIYKAKNWIKKQKFQWLFQTSCYFARNNYIIQYTKEMPVFATIAAVGDTPLLLYLATKGDYYYIEECMSTYNLYTEGSWMKEHANDSKKNLQKFIKDINMFFEYNNYTKNRYNKTIKKLNKTLKFYAYSIAQKNNIELNAIDENIKIGFNIKLHYRYVLFRHKCKVCLYKLLRIKSTN